VVDVHVLGLLGMMMMMMMIMTTTTTTTTCVSLMRRSVEMPCVSSLSGGVT